MVFKSNSLDIQLCLMQVFCNNNVVFQLLAASTLFQYTVCFIVRHICMHVRLEVEQQMLVKRSEGSVTVVCPDKFVVTRGFGV